MLNLSNYVTIFYVGVLLDAALEFTRETFFLTFAVVTESRSSSSKLTVDLSFIFVNLSN